VPIGRKLDVGVVELDLEQMQAWFKQENSTCEAPECDANPQPAFCWYQTQHSFVWLCQLHFEMTMVLSGMHLSTWNRKLAEHMYEKFLVRSYVHQNNTSGFALEAAIEVSQQAAKEIASLNKTADARAAREIRAAIKSSPVRIGSPDEEILTARGRQDARVAAGKPRIGRPSLNDPVKRTDRLVTLRAKLIVPSAKIISSSIQPSPQQDTQETQ
jgi:hypothetical protein